MVMVLGSMSATECTVTEGTVTAGRPTPDSLRLRAARADDALCLGVLATQVFLDTYATGGIRPAIAREVLAAFSSDAMAHAIAQDNICIAVAEIDGHLVGFSQLTLDASHPMAPPGRAAELFRLYVQEPFTARGIGRQLLRAAEVSAADRGATVLWLTPWVHNTRALRFYAHCGYEDHGPTAFHMEGETHENRVFARVLHGPAE